MGFYIYSPEPYVDTIIIIIPNLEMRKLMNREKRNPLHEVAELVLSTGDGTSVQAAWTAVHTLSLFLHYHIPISTKLSAVLLNNS